MTNVRSSSVRKQLLMRRLHTYKPRRSLRGYGAWSRGRGARAFRGEVPTDRSRIKGMTSFPNGPRINSLYDYTPARTATKRFPGGSCRDCTFTLIRREMKKVDD